MAHRLRSSVVLEMSLGFLVRKVDGYSYTVHGGVTVLIKRQITHSRVSPAPTHLSSSGTDAPRGQVPHLAHTPIGTLKEQVQNPGEGACAFIGVQWALVLPGSGHRGHEMSCRRG